MKAIICEYPWQLEYIGSEPEALLVSVNPEMSYKLEQSGRKYMECSELCQHIELWAEYPAFVHNFYTLTARLDEILWDTDSRFRDKNLPIFDMLGYMLKIVHDQSIYYAHLIRELMDLGVEKIACADNGGPAVDQYGMFSADKSIIPEVIRAFGIDAPDLEIHSTNTAKKPQKYDVFSFGQPIKLARRMGSKNICHFLRNPKDILRFRPCVPENVYKVLSVGCKEVDALDSARFNHISLLRLNPCINYYDRRKRWPHLKCFLDRVNEDETVNQLLRYRGAQLTGLVLHCIHFLADKLEFLLKKHMELFFFLDRISSDFVVFHTMAPFYLLNVIVYDWCRVRNLPFACWMHGGYGAYDSLQGYDVSDYRFSRDHLVYGQVIANLPLNPDWIINKLDYADQTKRLHVMGSPFFENLYSQYKRPENKRKKVLFCLGNIYGHNQFYFGHNRTNSELSIWRVHKRIIEELVKFQDDYDIVVKDYPYSPHRKMWTDILRDLGADKVNYIDHGRQFPEILVESDLHIFSWVSTTFFQSMYTDSDICLFDDTDLTTDSRNMFDQYLVFSSDLESFCFKLSEYLQNGEFYIQNKNTLREQYVDYSNKGQRPEKFELFVNNIFNKEN